ncbi:MAG: sigma-70 family RNA polymerase sigma factor [Terriglobales bacterium]
MPERGGISPGFDTLLQRWRHGDRGAGEQVFAAAYSELRRLAAYHFRGERDAHTLQPTALVHEVYVKLFTGEPVAWQDRAHFFALAARQMRQILIDHGRRRQTARRHQTLIPLELAPDPASAGPPLEDLLTVDEVLSELEQLEPRAANVLELRIFGGLKEEEIAEVLQVSLSTVKRDWIFSRAWLVKRLRN